MNGLQIVEQIALQVAGPLVQAEMAMLSQRLAASNNNQQIIAAVAVQTLGPIIAAEMQALEERLTAKLGGNPAPVGSESNIPRLVKTASVQLHEATRELPAPAVDTPVIVVDEKPAASE